MGAIALWSLRSTSRVAEEVPSPVSTVIACLPSISPGSLLSLTSPLKPSALQALGLQGSPDTAVTAISLSLHPHLCSGAVVCVLRCEGPAVGSGTADPPQSIVVVTVQYFAESQSCQPLLDTSSTPCARQKVPFKWLLETCSLRELHVTNPLPQEEMSTLAAKV